MKEREKKKLRLQIVSSQLMHKGYTMSQIFFKGSDSSSSGDDDDDDADGNEDFDEDDEDEDDDDDDDLSDVVDLDNLSEEEFNEVKEDPHKRGNNIKRNPMKKK